MPQRFSTINQVAKEEGSKSRSGSVRRPHGRITKEDIRAARLRRWNGRSRITTDWLNLYQEPELSFPTGDLLVYLRQQGQSSRGPAFRVHSDVLATRGFQSLLDRCVQQPSLHAPKDCLLKSCPGCERHVSVKELYIPAPITTSIDTVFDFHITTRNFFAWLYDIPLAGRALGRSLVTVKDRIDQYRQCRDAVRNKKEIIAYCESQKYLDFRECIDHALAALCLAEHLQQEDMWVDAFAHVVGMANKDLNSNIEYSSNSPAVQRLVVNSRLEMDVRTARASTSIETFFGDDLSGNFLGLTQAARDHFDRFRSFLHGFYIDRFGFWPPAGFGDEAGRSTIYLSLYSDFRDLYHHLVDPESTPDATGDLVSTGGICTLQNIQVFDSRHGFDTLPQPLPRLPADVLLDTKMTPSQRRRSWNPVAQKRIEKESRRALQVGALIRSSNRDMTIMNRPLVRQYSEYESNSIADELEQIHWIEGRKIRWILIYAIFQTLISVQGVPKYVRNTEGLSYSLCCHIPAQMPWARNVPSKRPQSSMKEIVPDFNYLTANSSTTNIETRSSRSAERVDRRQTMPGRSRSLNPRSTSLPRIGSFKRLLSRTRSSPPVPALPQSSFHEIIVHGYGNGLNEVSHSPQSETTLPSEVQIRHRSSLLPDMLVDVEFVNNSRPCSSMPQQGDDVPDLSPSTSGSVSRESSTASTGSSKTAKTETELHTPTEIKSISKVGNMLKAATLFSVDYENELIYDEIDGFPGSIHINTSTWDKILSQ